MDKCIADMYQLHSVINIKIYKYKFSNYLNAIVICCTLYNINNNIQYIIILL